MRRLIAALLTVVTMVTIAVPSTAPVRAEAPADVEVDESAMVDAPPVTPPDPVSDPEPEPQPPQSDPAPEPEPEPDPEPPISDAGLSDVSDPAPPPVEDAPALEPAPAGSSNPTVVAHHVDDPQWTEPIYPEQPQPTECVQQKIEKATSTYLDGTWSEWTDWPDAGPVWDDGRTRTGHHGGPHGENGDRHYAYIVVDTRPITTGACTPQVSVEMGEEVETCLGDIPSYLLEWTATTTLAGTYEIWVHRRNIAPTAGERYEEAPLPVPGTSGTVTIPSNDPPLYDSRSGAVTIIATVGGVQYRSTERTSGEASCTDVPTYPDDEEIERAECQPGDDTVTVTTTTTSYVAVWNEVTETWDKTIDEVVVTESEDALTVQEQADCQRPPLVEETTEDVSYTCGDTTVETTTTTTTTPSIYADDQWVLDNDNATTTTSDTTRPLTDDDDFDCPLIEIETERDDCQPGDNTVTVTTTTTTYNSYTWIDDTWIPQPDNTALTETQEPLNEQEQAACQPPPEQDIGEWQDSTYTCGDATVEQTRTVTKTPYTYDGGQWVLDPYNQTATTDTRTRPLTDDDDFDCPTDTRRNPCGPGDNTVTVTTTATVYTYTWNGDTWDQNDDPTTTETESEDALTVQEQADCQRPPLVEETTEDVSYTCGDSTVETTTTTTTTPSIYADDQWVLDNDNATTTTSDTTRPLTDDDDFDCPLIEIETERDDCQPGDNTVTVTTTTTTYNSYTWIDDTWIPQPDNTALTETQEPLTVQEQADCQKPPLVEETTEDVSYTCGDTNVETTTTTTTTPSIYADDQWVLDNDNATTTTSDTTRPLTDDDDFDCPSIRDDCAPGDNTVTVTSTIYSYTWNSNTESWDQDDDPTTTETEAALNEQEQADCRPVPPNQTIRTEWEDSTYTCGDDTVRQTRTVTTTPYVYLDDQWVLDEDGQTTNTQARNRPLTPQEQDEFSDCAPLVQVVRSDCATGEDTVTVTTTTTNYGAAWNGETWVKVVDEITTTRTRSPLDAEEQDECRPDDRTSFEVARSACRTGDNTVTVTTTMTTTTAIWSGAGWDTQIASVSSTARSRALDDDEQSRCRPGPSIATTAWVDGTFECDDTTVAQTRTVTTRPYIYAAGAWRLNDDISTRITESRTRVLDDDETTECPEPPLDVTITSVCENDVPYITWQANPPAGSPDTATVSLFDVEGNPVGEPFVGQPLSGRMLYPGASVDPQDWPGWKLDDAGEWVVDPTDAFLREGVRVVVDVNPTGEGAVGYPPPTPQCAAGPDPTITFRSVNVVCRSRIPHISYLLEGDPFDSASQFAALLLYDIDGSPISDLPLTAKSGQLLYPGASTDPQDWPGWRLVDGEWQVDPTDQRLTNGGIVVLEVGDNEVDRHAYAAIPRECDHPPDEEPVERAIVWTACRNGVPFIEYRLIGTESDTVTVVLSDVDGNVVDRIVRAPIQGTIVYPGAGIDPRDWPGWVARDNDWVTDETDARLRNGGKLTARTASGDDVAIAYGGIPDACNDPAGPPDESSEQQDGSTEPTGGVDDSGVVIRTATWECEAGPTAPRIEYTVDVELDDTDRITLRLLSLAGNVVEVQADQPLNGAIDFPDELRSGGTLEFVVTTTGDVDISARAPDTCFPLGVDGQLIVAVLGDDETAGDPACREQFNYLASFYAETRPTEPSDRDPTELLTGGNAKAEILLPRQVRHAGDDRDDRALNFTVDIEPGEVKTVPMPVEVVFGVGTTVVAELFLIAEGTKGDITVYADSEPTTVDTSCPAPNTSPNR